MWKLLVHTTKDGNKVVFEGLDCFFGTVAMMVMRWDELEQHFVCFDGVVVELSGAFVVKDMVLEGDAGSV
jgi:hypothetical protein